VSSAIWFHCATVFPGGSAAVALPVVPSEVATASALDEFRVFVAISVSIKI